MENEKYLTKDEFQKFLERFDRFLEEDRRRWEENTRKWEENQRRWEEENRRWWQNWEENKKRWEENEKKWEEENRRWWQNWEENKKRWEENERRWEENKKRWEENERRWEENNKKWEEDRKRWEEESRRWWENQQVINKMLSQLTRHGDFIGFGVEGMAAILLPYYLENKHKLKIKNLRKKLISWNGKEVEINLYVEAKKGRKKYVVLTECKTTVGKKSVIDFLKKIKIAEKYFKDAVLIKIIFGPFVLPEAAKLARKHNIEIVSNVPQEV